MKKKLLVYIFIIISIFILETNFIQAKTLSTDKLYINTYSSVHTAIITKKQCDINVARSLINFEACWAVGNFSYHIHKIIQAINIAKNNPTQSNVNKAKLSIDIDLPIELKRSFSSSIDEIEQGIINDAVNTYDIALSTKDSNIAFSALNKIKDIETSTDITVVNWANNFDLQINALLASINVQSSALKVLTVKNIVKNINAIVLVEVKDSNNNVISTGSGFFISSDGKIVTCYHVIDNAYSVDIKIQDGTKYDISGVLGFSKEKDFAIMKIDNVSNMPIVNLGDSNKVELADNIVTIGSPLGIQNTISTGIVSGLNRESLTGRNGNDIQITAPTTNGSSGGALFNMYGQVIGITYAGEDTQGDLNFAIPINEIKSSINVSTLVSLIDLNKK